MTFTNRRAYYRDRRMLMNPEQKQHDTEMREKWKAEHPDTVRASQKKYRQTSPKYKAYAKAYRKRILAASQEKRDGLYKYNMRRTRIKKFLAKQLPEDVQEEMMLKARAMRIRTHVRRLFRAIDSVDNPWEYLKQHRIWPKDD